MAFDTIIKKLESEPEYNVDFQTKPDFYKNGRMYKRISYEYYDEKKEIIVMSCVDISSIIMNETDPLTGLYNSTGFHHHVKEWIAENPNKKYRIQRYDIDRFKDINGFYGYDAGNKLLRDFGFHMKRYDTKNSFAAHLNSDHFVRFCSEEDSMSVKEFYNTFKACFKNYNLDMPISIHVGVYDLCEPDCDSFTMSYKALLALQTAKGDLSRHIVYYEKGMMDNELYNQRILKSIDTAISNDEFEVWFQPQVDYETKRLTGAEALVRWRNPEKGLIPPVNFIPILEKSGSIYKLDCYIIEKACRYMQNGRKNFPIFLLWCRLIFRETIYTATASASISKKLRKNTEFPQTVSIWKLRKAHT